jgi:signal transduction histidine kinase
MAPGKNKSSLGVLLERWASYLSDGRAVSFSAFAIITPPSIFFAFLTYFGRTNNPGWLEAITIVFAHFGLYLGLVVGRRPILGKSTNPTALRILTLYLFASQVTAASLIFFLRLPIVSSSSGISAWVVSIFGGMVSITWLTISHLVASLWMQNFQLVHNLRTKALQLEEVRSVAQGELSAQLRQLREVVSEKIDRVLEGIQLQVRALNTKSSPNDFLASAQRIRSLSNQEVRELSHQIAASDFSEAGLQSIRPTWWATWKEALKTTGDTQLYWPWVAGIGSVNAISLAMHRNGPLEVLTYLFGLAVGIVVLRALDLVREPLFIRASDLAKTASVLVLYLLTSVSVTGLISLGAQLVPEVAEYTTLMMASIPVAIFFLWFMVFMIRGFVQNSRLRALDLTDQSRLLEAEIQRAQAATHAAREKLSKVLHGTVQGRLASVSLALTASAEAHSAEAAADLLARAKDQLDLTREDLNNALWNFQDDEDVNAELADLIESWKSILDVDFKISTMAANFLNERQDIGTHVLNAQREAITNAARHANSKSISIWIDLEPKQDPKLVVMNAANDLVTKDEIPQPGFGFNSLKNYASSVEFKVEDSTATLRVVWLIEDF